ncbi:transporter substrate-binding domain-containing protein [Desulfobotulus sp. H1]|uniref:Transporter substrate-binding domain-containing protein n=1 Tax=Desulfobotulus pelophilus TaxID=2823377 RepID=A0ABT3N856_9BACT|nr:transporter substrate-binding domain-containing protein [Desulfobotulus pelophilus]MCW7753639.1 transporter substrate-binding domain-containing protein [Desulfobotulus pelophilus]
MKMKTTVVMVFLLSQWMLISGSFAQTVVVYGLDAMPLCGVVDGEPVGITVEILKEATAYGAPDFIFRMDVPWVRAQMLVQQPGSEVNAIIPFSRSRQREDTFKWVGELVQTQFRFYSYERKNPINSIDEARELNIGVVRGHAIIPLLQQQGIVRLDETRNAEINAQKLLYKRLDAMADSDFIALHNWRQIGQNTQNLQEGIAIGDITRVYIAAGLHFPYDTAKNIADALGRMKQDGKMEEILSRWK